MMTMDLTKRIARLDADGTVRFANHAIGVWALGDDRFYRFKPTGSTVWTIQADRRPHLRNAITALSRAKARRSF